MECQRLNKMIRSWYMQIQDETLAPARMVEFMEKHVRSCDDCLMDANIREELKKIIAIVLPPSKMTKAPKSAAAEAPEMPVPIPPKAPAVDDEDDEDDEGEDDSESDDDSDDMDEDLDDDDIEVDDDDDLELADGDLT